MIRIASPDFDLLQKFCDSLHGVVAVPVRADELGLRKDEADLFLLRNDEALRFAEACGSSGPRPTLICVVGEQEAAPSSFLGGIADDMLVLPFRGLDADRLLRAHTQAEALRAMDESARGIPALVEKLQADIRMAEKIQRRLIREKFPPMGGLTVKSKYWCGLKAGGDYFDVFEFADGEHVGIILSDSSSYGLSTNFIGSLMQFSVNLSGEAVVDPARIVSSLYAKLQDQMKDTDKFSVFYGVLSRKTYQLRFVDCGSVFAAVKGADGAISFACRGENLPLSKEYGAVPATREVALEPGERLMVASDGWAESLNEDSVHLVKRFLSGPADGQDLLNAMAFELRKGVVKHFELDDAEEEDFPMPPQDCSVMVFDVAKNVLRLAR
jgi:hypothetical protein